MKPQILFFILTLSFFKANAIDKITLKNQMTFENKKRMNQVISSQGLIKMIKELDVMPTAGSFVTSIRIRQDIPLLIKLIN